MWLAALGALDAFAASLGAVRQAGSDSVWLETWRMFGFAVFAGLFALVAWRPRRIPGVWELAFGHKLAIAVAALFLAPAPEARAAGLVDAVLAGLIAVAYISAIASKSVRNDALWDALVTDQSFEEALGGTGITVFLE